MKIKSLIGEGNHGLTAGKVYALHPCVPLPCPLHNARADVCVIDDDGESHTITARNYEIVQDEEEQ